MTREVSHSALSQPRSPTLEIVTPLSTRMLFWRARYLDDSAFLCHVPFLFWLIETSRPKQFVELGLGTGVSYFAACQAIDKLDLDARCHGISPGSALPEPVERYNAQNYGDFSRLHTDDLTHAAQRFDDGSIDLLLVDVDLGEAGALDCLSHDWMRKLSPRGILLLHGTNTRFADGYVRKFLSRLLGSCPAITMEDGEGLTAVLYGEDRNERLVKLADLGFGMTGYSEVHHVFGRLGAAHRFEWASRVADSKAAEAKKRIAAAEKALQATEERRETVQNKLDTLNKAYDSRNAQIATLQARFFDLQVTEEQDETEAEVLRRKLAEVRTQYAEAVAARDAVLAEKQERVEGQAEELERLDAQKADRFDEIATLTRMLEAKEQERAAALGAAKKAREEEIAKRDRMIARLTAEQAEHVKTIAARDKELAAAKKAQEAEAAQREKLSGSLTAERAQHARALASRDAALAERQEAVAGLEARLAERFDEIAALTRLLEDRDRALAAASETREMEAAAQNGSLLAYEEDIRRLQQELEEVQAHRDALLNSTSWKLTRPARSVLNAMRR
ncbi:class I SAM-dependent methyltransferase [Pontibaca methylaminivorans]|uniref:Methyltransferase domain-containing protein n=1 Tax=Pontibaca methylaminivorans TaxID=515897 RepID=A0A1R3WDE4_9RHOB|nr:class I SAM-dependent methyltransferase [Pontibaca methylaminivorans]SIT74404.1 Methyltransferase domain-containing protein [Pontibaca methylaminivorans]